MIRKVPFTDREVQVPPGYSHLTRSLKKFAKRFPQYGSNVFVMMPFEDTRHNRAVFDAIFRALANYGLVALRADLREYAPNLWDNVCTYILGCKYGIAVFEKGARGSFNPNVAVELGFSLARNKTVLILKERRVPGLPSDIVGRLYRQFDSQRLGATIERQIKAWATSLNLKQRDSQPPMLKLLTPREEMIVKMFYGIGRQKRASHQDIARAFMFTPRKVKGILRTAEKKLEGLLLRKELNRWSAPRPAQ